MAKFPMYEEMGKKVAEKALDEFLYDGKSIREWMHIIASEDAISRQSVLDYIYNDLGLGDEENGKDVERQMELESSYRYVKTLPSITPQQKTGHWVEENINGGRKIFCSNCGSQPPFEHVSNGDVYSASGHGVINKTKYCHNCGAKMVEPQESEVGE